MIEPEFYTGPILGDFLRAVERGELQPLAYLGERPAPEGCYGFTFPENPGIVETYIGRFRASDGYQLDNEEAEDYSALTLVPLGDGEVSRFSSAEWADGEVWE